MVTVKVQSMSENKETIKSLLLGGLFEEKRRIIFALGKANIAIKKYESKFGYSTQSFIEKFHKNEIEENDETFDWWAETKVVNELKEKLKTITEIEICQ